MNVKSDTIKKEFALMLLKNLGLVVTTCNEAGISRDTYYRWVSEDKEFREACEEAIDTAVESVIKLLHREIDNGNTTAIIYYLNRKGYKYGFSNKGGKEIMNLKKGCKNIDQINESYDEIWEKASEGEMSIDTAISMSNVLENKRKAIDTDELARKILQLELLMKRDKSMV